MRVRSHIWVSAFIRAEMADGAYSAVLRTGSPEAGAIFVIHNHLDGTCTGFAPAPQTAFGPDATGERLFEKRLDRVAEAAAREWIDRQVDFDPDCWIVETERRHGEPGLIDTAGLP